MSTEVGFLFALPFLLLAGAAKSVVEVGRATASATAAGTISTARLVQQGASWIRANGLAVDQLAGMTMGPTNLSRTEFHALVQASGLKTAKIVHNAGLGLDMTPITMAGQKVGLIQAGNSFHLVGAASLIQAGPKVVPELASFGQTVNATAAMKAMASLGANLKAVQTHRDHTGMLYIDVDVPNPAQSFRPAQMAKPTPKTLNVGTLARRITAIEIQSPSLQYQRPPEGHLRVSMEVAPDGQLNVSVFGDHGYEEECKPVADALTEAFGNAQVFCNLRGIGQAPPPGAGLIPMPEPVTAPANAVRPVQNAHVRR